MPKKIRLTNSEKSKRLLKLKKLLDKDDKVTLAKMKNILKSPSICYAIIKTGTVSKTKDGSYAWKGPNNINKENAVMIYDNINKQTRSSRKSFIGKREVKEIDQDYSNELVEKLENKALSQDDQELIDEIRGLKELNQKLIKINKENSIKLSAIVSAVSLQNYNFFKEG